MPLLCSGPENQCAKVAAQIQSSYCKEHQYELDCLPTEEKVGIALLLIGIIIFIVLKLKIFKIVLKFMLKTEKRKRIFKTVLLAIAFWIFGGAVLSLLFTILVGKSYSIFSSLLALIVSVYVAKKYYFIQITTAKAILFLVLIMLLLPVLLVGWVYGVGYGFVAAIFMFMIYAPIYHKLTLNKRKHRKRKKHRVAKKALLSLIDDDLDDDEDNDLDNIPPAPPAIK